MGTGFFFHFINFAQTQVIFYSELTSKNIPFCFICAVVFNRDHCGESCAPSRNSSPSQKFFFHCFSLQPPAWHTLFSFNCVFFFLNDLFRAFRCTGILRICCFDAVDLPGRPDAVIGKLHTGIYGGSHKWIASGFLATRLARRRSPAVRQVEMPVCSAKSVASSSLLRPRKTLQRMSRSLPPLQARRALRVLPIKDVIIVKPVACLAIGADILVYLSGVCPAELNAFCALKSSPGRPHRVVSVDSSTCLVFLRFICILLFADI